MASTQTWTCALILGFVAASAGCGGSSTTPAADADGQVERATTTPALFGVRWILTELPRSDAKVPQPADDARAAGPEIEFDAEEKRVAGSTGVNRFSGPYELSGESLRFGPLATTRRAGAPEAMQLEDAYVQALTSTRAHRFDGQNLELLGGDGKPVARFRATTPRTNRPPTATAPAPAP